ncbi:MAG TPA: hypothetical protein VM686_42035 [Polyangiaceae bacterium]|nr:hypothetical protein [Polyangiaceae bacterium]
MSFTPHGLQIVQVDNEHAIGIWGEFMLAVWRRKTELAAVQHLRHKLGDLGARYPSGTATISVIEQTAVPPDNDARKELSAVLTTPRLQCSSLVYEGTGFQAATVRGVVTAITLLRTHPVPHVIHASVREGVQWSLKTLGKSDSGKLAADLERVIEELRGKITSASDARR